MTKQSLVLLPLDDVLGIVDDWVHLVEQDLDELCDLLIWQPLDGLDQILAVLVSQFEAKRHSSAADHRLASGLKCLPLLCGEALLLHICLVECCDGSSQELLLLDDLHDVSCAELLVLHWKVVALIHEAVSEVLVQDLRQQVLDVHDLDVGGCLLSLADLRQLRFGVLVKHLERLKLVEFLIIVVEWLSI